jgi:outer membrane receptor protein involved in Fe transport
MKPVFFFFTLFIFLFPGACWEARAQIDSLLVKPYTADIQDFTIKENEEKVSITSQTPLFLKEAPGSVSIITEEEIQAIGARDLNDVLRLIPGFGFSVDVQGVVGLGVRGNSANEGTLLLIDGLEMNDLLYGSNQFGNHFAIDQIRRIEVIRGPGSIIYGGFAVYAVINIITKSSEWFNGFRMAQTVGETEKGAGLRNFSGSLGTLRKNFTLSITGSLSEAQRSDRTYADVFGNSYSMLNQSRLDHKFLVFHSKYKNLFIKGLIDHYLTQSRDNQTETSSKPYPVDFKSYHMELLYDWRIKDKLNIQPFFNIRHQLPWATSPDIDSVDRDKVIPLMVEANRMISGLKSIWRPSSQLEILLQSNYTIDWSKDRLKSDSSDQSANYYCQTALGQGIWKSKWANFIFGLRFDNHSYYKPILTPRLAINRSFGTVYGKLSFNRSFRTPAFSNIYLSMEEKIQPQITDCIETEWGANLSKNLNISLNIYNNSIRNGIVYSVLEDGFTEGYSNSGKMGTSGFEIQSRGNFKKWSLFSAWSFYSTGLSSTYQAFKVPETRINLAYPAHKVNLVLGYELPQNIKWTNTFIWLSDRYGYEGSLGNPRYVNYGKIFLFNTFVQAKDFYLKGLSIGFGVYNVLNTKYNFIQSYNSGHMPLPSRSREYVLKIIYGLNLSK